MSSTLIHEKKMLKKLPAQNNRNRNLKELQKILFLKQKIIRYRIAVKNESIMPFFRQSFHEKFIHINPMEIINSARIYFASQLLLLLPLGE